MKFNANLSFAKQLIIYLLIILFIGFLFISLALMNSLEQFISHNAYAQSNILAANVLDIFEREIKRIEQIPENITELQDKLTSNNLASIPEHILKCYPILIGCSVHYNPTYRKLGHTPHITAYRLSDGSIRQASGTACCDSDTPEPHRIIRKNDKQGYWIHSHIKNNKTIAYCQPICDKENTCGIVKIDFPLQTVTELICNYKLFHSGYIFIVDQSGEYITSKASHDTQPLVALNDLYNPAYSKLLEKIKQGKTGYSTISLHQSKYYIYHTPIKIMNWQLGIICAQDKILQSSDKLYILLFLCLGLGLLFLFIGIINIVRRLSFPLKQLALSARRIAEGQFNTPLITPKSNKEIRELYDSFRYMQQSIRDHIKRLQTTMAEKEKMNSEMILAQRIQQRFLPQHPLISENIELAAELRQSSEVGGDLYEFFQLDNRLYFAIGDVCGKGIPAALYMASVSNLFRYVASCNSSISDICSIINRHMCKDFSDDMYITMFMGIIDVNTGILTYTNAGQPYPLIILESGKSHFLDKAPDVPIGVIEEHKFKEHLYTLRKNMSILLYTDGITDAENANGQFYGKEKMIKLIESIPERSPAILLECLLEDIRRHGGNANTSDDMTLMVISYKGIPTHPILPGDGSFPD